MYHIPKQYYCQPINNITLNRDSPKDLVHVSGTHTWDISVTLDIARLLKRYNNSDDVVSSIHHTLRQHPSVFCRDRTQARDIRPPPQPFVTQLTSILSYILNNDSAELNKKLTGYESVTVDPVSVRQQLEVNGMFYHNMVSREQLTDLYSQIDSRELETGDSIIVTTMLIDDDKSHTDSRRDKYRLRLQLTQTSGEAVAPLYDVHGQLFEDM
jgi:hypothetical protein